MRPTSTPAAEDEFRYGWRFVQRGGDLVQIPLTLEDCLHPQEGDAIPKNTSHTDDCMYLAGVFRCRPFSPAFTLVSRDLGVEWGVPGIRPHSPDVAVFVELRSEPPRRTALLELPAFGGRCELVVEVVSPSTRANDVVHKFDHYFRVGIPLYVIIDQEGEDGPRSVRAYRHTPSGYEPIAPDDQGRVALPPVGLLLGMRDDRAVCYDATTGEEMDDFPTLLRKRDELRRFKQQMMAARAVAEIARADANEQRRNLEETAKLIRDLQEQLRRLQSGGPNPTP